MKRIANIGGGATRRDAVPSCPCRRVAGFTLVEMLAAIIVLTLLTMMVATGTGVASKLYQSSQFESQSELLSSQINTALADPFRFMTYDKGTGKYTIVYQDNSVDGTIVDAAPTLVSVDGRLYLRGSVTDTSVTPNVTESKDLKVLNAGAYGTCSVTIDSFKITCKDKATNPDATNLVTFTYTITSTANSALSHQYTVSFGYDPSDGLTKVLPTS